MIESGLIFIKVWVNSEKTGAFLHKNNIISTEKVRYFGIFENCCQHSPLLSIYYPVVYKNG